MQQTHLFSLDRASYERFKQFHRSNPEVYRLFLHFAREARQVTDHLGARLIWERLRWHIAIETTGNDFKLNDHYTPYYARLAMLEYPLELGGFFETRDARFDTTESEMRKDLINAPVA